MKLTILLENMKAKVALDFLSQLVRNSPFKGQVFVAGGYVRDELLGKPSKDVDLVVTAPDGGIEFSKWLTKKLGVYSNTNPIIYPRFGTAKFNLRGITHDGIDLSDLDIEAVMTRTETYTDGSRKPDVEYGSLKDDAMRRDFTVNSLMKDLTTGKILDLTGMGIHDLKAGIVQSAIDPNLIFAEDPLRMLRAIRFATKYNWKLPQEMQDAIRDNASQIQKISAERIQDELNKMLLTNDPAKAVRLMQSTGLNDYVLPELSKLKGVTQNHYHKDDVFDHSLEVVSRVPPEIRTRIAALFHDIGKADAKTVVDGAVHFYDHENIGADLARAILTRLKYPNEIIDAVEAGVRNHMRLKQSGLAGEKATDKTLRRFAADLGDHLEMTLDVMDADNRSHASQYSTDRQIPNIRQRLKTLSPPSVKVTLPINGNDIMDQLQVKPGPLLAVLLDVVKDAYFANPNISAGDAMKLVTSTYEDLKAKAQSKQDTPSAKLGDHLPEKIRNPKTDNDILLKTALSYDKDHPARQAAERILNKAKKSK